MNLLPVLTFSSNDFPQAEQLLDLIAIQRDKKPSGYILLVAAPDTHPEQHKRMQIAAKIGFESVGLLPVGWKKDAGKGKYEQVNHVFQTAAAHIHRHYKNPFLWLEPDSVPLNSKWLANITAAYHEQPKLYLGPIVADDAGKKMMGRVAVYPTTCLQDIGKACDGKAPFEVTAGEPLVHRATKSKLFQQLVINKPEDLQKIREDAAIVHGDKLGILLAKKIEEYSAPEKPDGRTRAGRAAKTSA